MLGELIRHIIRENISRSMVLWAVLLLPCVAIAQPNSVIRTAEAGKDGDSVAVVITLNPEMLELADENTLTLTPCIAAQGDTVELPSIHVMGRKPYYRYVRHDDMGLPVRAGDNVIWTKRRYRPFVYVNKVRYEKWMLGGTLLITQTERDGCGATVATSGERRELSQMTVVPAQSTKEVITSTLADRLSIRFPLNEVTIHPELGKNSSELEKIRAGLDQVRKDPSATLKRLIVKGFASPEGSYEHNEYLAQGRTQSIADYVMQHFGLTLDQVEVEYEAEDWDGLAAWIREAPTSVLPHRNELLAIATSMTEPDEREAKMRKYYPGEFRYMLEHAMPLLRHTDYRIEYVHRDNVEHVGETDTLWQMRLAGVVPTSVAPRVKTFRTVMAVKTNLLFDAALAPNVEVEFTLDKKQRWSLMAEYWTPWYVWHHNSRAYEIQTWGLELRRWNGKCRERKPALTGTFWGAYAAFARYDLEWNSSGDQGEAYSVGITYGRSWPIHRHWNFELSASIGAFYGPRRHYEGEFNDTHLIWKYNGTVFYAGPTKLKASLVWLIGKKRKEGGR